MSDIYRHTPIGEEARYNCPWCSDTRERLYVKRQRFGWTYHCHNCGKGGVKPNKESNSLDDIRSYLDSRTRKNDLDSSLSYIRLPSDCSWGLPSQVYLWLDRYAITADETTKYHFQYSEKLNRLILPLYNQQGELIYWQGRYLGKPDKQHPKYINSKSKKDSFAVFKPHSPVVCLVEDILSAIKVGRQIAAIPILGSYLPMKLLTYLKGYDRIYVWLDLDKRFESLRMSQRIRTLTGAPCSSIITELDPKEYSDEEIRTYITV